MTMGQETSGRLDRGDGIALAWRHLAGTPPTAVFLPGFRSDMTGDKASAVFAHCRATGRAALLLDYSGHGASDGAFEDGTIGTWRDDAAAVFDAKAPGPLLLIGSSMGGWIALLLARALGGRVHGLIGIAAAPDFTETLIRPSLTDAEQATLARDGVVRRPSDYGEPLPITARLLDDGRRHRLLGAPIPIACPVRLLHGQRDPDVPWRTALAIAERLAGDDVRVVLVKDGDHRLSRPTDVALLRDVVDSLAVRDTR